MSINVQHSRARIVQAVSAGALVPHYSGNYFTYHGMPYMGDWLLFNSCNNWSPGVVSPTLALGKYCGIGTAFLDKFGVDEVFYTSRPGKVNYDRNDDVRNYGNLLTSLKDVAASFGQPRELHPSSEHGVGHIAFNGNVVDSEPTSRVRITDYSVTTGGEINCPLYVFKDGVPACNIVQEWFDPEDPISGRALLSEYGAYTDYGTQLYNWDLFAQADQVAYIKPHFVGFDQITEFNFRYDWNSIDTGVWAISRSGIAVRRLRASYRFTMNYAPVGELYQWYFDVERDISVTIVPNSIRTTGLGSGFRINDVFNIVDNSTVSPAGISARLASDYGDAFSPFYDLARCGNDVKVTKIGHPALASSIAQPTKDLSANFARFRSNSLYPKRYSRAQEAEILFNENIKDIRPSSFLAAKAALQENVSVLSFNLLQDLQHLQDIASVVPDFAQVGILAAQAVKGDISVIPKIIDFLTESVLKYNFQQRPLIKDGRELLATDLLKGLEAVVKFREFTWYGKFNYTFLPNENFFRDGTLELETRVKLRGSVDLTSFLATCFALNGAGALPTLSRVWSLVPFSFVVDWFTNESKRLEAVDAQFAYLCINVYWCLYSYKLYWRPSAEELMRYDLAQDSSDPFYLTVYRRELSRLMPRLTDSRFDFLRRNNSPDPVTVGSLLWQLLS